MTQQSTTNNQTMIRLLPLIIAALALSFTPPQQGSSTCPCERTFNTIPSASGTCAGVMWVEAVGRGGQCPEIFGGGCTINGSLGCQSNGILIETGCQGGEGPASAFLQLDTGDCDQSDSDGMPATGGTGYHLIILICGECQQS